MPNRQNDFVGVFDSGVGGISVLASLMDELPNEDFLYFGDSSNAPYGEKPRDWVIRRSRRIADTLIEAGAKAIVIACNTATSAAAETLRADYAHIPIIGVEPALKPATLQDGVQTILVMATPITLRLDKYQQLAKRLRGGHTVIDAPCPGLASRIEQGHLDDEDLTDLIDALVGAYRGQADAVVLGCTHYVFASRAIRDVLGDVPLFDGARGTARQLHRKLAERGLIANKARGGHVVFKSSNDAEEELRLYAAFLKRAQTSR